MEGGGGGGSNPSSSCVMAFGGGNINHHDNNNNNNSNGLGYCPIMMNMPPPPPPLPMASSSSHPSNTNQHTCTRNNNNNTEFHQHQDLNRHNNTSGGGVGSSMMVRQEQHQHHTATNNSITSTGYYFMDTTNNNCSTTKDKIMAHPHYHRLLSAYANCQKIGAPSEVVAKLEEACGSAVAAAMGRHGGTSAVGEDPALDQFMEAYCEMLSKYEQELSKPFKEAMLFLDRIDSQFKALTLSPSSAPTTTHLHHPGAEAMERNGSSEEEVDVNNNYNNNNSFIDPQAEDRELKGQLLRKYSGYLGSLKQEFMKKRKKGKLPKEARQQLLDWWTRHYKWPYPSESQKLALAESTGLDQKQINNWFINQRKRHWKPSEDMQFVVMDATQPHYYMDNVLGNPFPMDISPALL